MKKLTTLYFLLTVSLVFGQFVDLGQKVIGGSGDDYLIRYEDTLNNSSYLVGHSYSNVSFDKSENSRGENDIWIIKLDENDQKIWDKTIGGDLSDYTSECFFLDNKIYILGNSRSSISGEKTMNSFAGFDWWLVVLDTNGTLLWQKQYGGNHNDYLRKYVILNNGNILLIGTSESTPSSTIGNKTSPNIGNQDFWLVEINPTDGAIVQQKTIGTFADDIINDVKITASTKIIIKGGAWCGLSGDKTDFGYTSPNSGGISTNMWVITLDQNLNKLNDKCFGSGGEGGSGSMILTDSAFYFAVDSRTGIGGNKTAPNRGCINSNNCSDYWVVKTDTNLNIIWDQSYGGNNNEYPGNITFFNEDKLVLSGGSNSEESGNKTTQQYGGFDNWFLIINEIDGSIVTQKTYGGTGDDYCILKVNQNDSSKLIIEGSSESTISGNKTVYSKGGFDFWMVELDASNYLATEELDAEGASISVYPNPYSEQVNFKFEQLKEAVTLSIATLEGKIVHTQTIQPSNENIEITWKPILSEQFLVYTIKGEKTSFTGKLVGF
jgi:hypothetical protein